MVQASLLIVLIVAQGKIESAGDQFRAMKMVLRKCCEKFHYVLRNDFPCLFNGATLSQIRQRVAAGLSINAAVRQEIDLGDDMVLDRQEDFHCITAIADSLSISIRMLRDLPLIMFECHYKKLW